MASSGVLIFALIGHNTIKIPEIFQVFMVFPVTLFIGMEFTNVRKVYKKKGEPLGSCRRSSFLKFWLFFGLSETRNLNAQMPLELFL